MKIFQSWKRNSPDASGESLTVTITYSSVRKEEIDELEAKLPKGYIVAEMEETKSEQSRRDR